MDHFQIIQALCRSVLASSTPAGRKQVERLRDALTADGDTAAAEALSQLLESLDRTPQMSPSRMVRSAVALGGEELTARTPVPVDKETSNPLAQVIFPADLPEQPPVLDEQMQSALTTLLNEWEHLDVLADAGVPPARSCLIYGAPGTGKTHLALWISRSLGLPVAVARLDGLVSSFLGTTARNISALFTFAARYRCLLLLDEFDAVAKLRDDPQEVGEIKRVVNALLQNLDQRRTVGLTIGITNHEGLLDPAIWRRFEIQLAMPRPSFAARLSLVRQHLVPLALNEPSQKLLAWLTEDATGAEVELLVRSMKRAVVLGISDETSPIAVVQQFLTMHSGRLRPDRRAALDLEQGALVRHLLEDGTLGFAQSDIATLFNRDKATISRWVRQPRKHPPHKK